MAQLFEFEKPIAELVVRIAEIQKFSADKGIDLSQEVATLEKSGTLEEGDLWKS